MYRNSRRQSGFTIIELSLAMLFISALLISIALLTIYIGHLYNRGSTMKEINQAGTEISGDIKRSIAASGRNNVTLKLIGVGAAPMPPGYTGYHAWLYVLCTANASYVINNPGWLDNYPASGSISHLAFFTGSTDPIRFGKINSGALCSSSITNVSTLQTAINAAGASNQRELLAGDIGHSLSIWQVGYGGYPSFTDTRLVGFGFYLGTSELTDFAPTTLAGNIPTCQISGVTEWCGINAFGVVARTSNTE